jgi:RimJ/RimL family protein N-acetyltransferase
MPTRVVFRRLSGVAELDRAGGEDSPIASLRHALADCPTACPEWCFVAETDGRCTAAVGFRGSRRLPPTDHVPQDLYLLDLWAKWHDARVDHICAALLHHALAALYAQGVRMMTAYVDFAEPIAVRKAAALDALRIPLFQERAHYVYGQREAVLPVSPRLTYQSLSAAGREPFVAAIRRINNGALDRGIQQNVRLLGERHAGEQTFDEIADRDWQTSYQADLWRLGYDANGHLIGLVMPIVFWEGRAAIGFIGVVPEQRGKGYVSDLLAEGTRLLVNAGQREIVADIDRANLPMAAALARVGYVPHGGERIYDVAIGEWLKTAKSVT